MVKHCYIFRERYIQSICIIFCLLRSGIKPLPCNREGECCRGFQYTVISVVVLEIGVFNSWKHRTFILILLVLCSVKINSQNQPYVQRNIYRKMHKISHVFRHSMGAIIRES
jgi:hypothetical protein